MKNKLVIYAFAFFSNCNFYIAQTFNLDFEASPAGTITTMNQIAGWTITSGSHQNSLTANSCNLIGCCPSNPFESELISAPTGYIDPNIGNSYPIYSVFGTIPGNTVNPEAYCMSGQNFIRISSSLGNYGIEKLSKNIFVSQSDTVFHLAFFPVFKLGGGHSCCDGPLLNITLKDSILGNITYTFVSSSFACQSTDQLCSNGYVSYFPWRIHSFDLKPHVGHIINLSISLSDCIGGGHFAYAYIDAEFGGTAPVTNLPRIVVDGKLITDTTGIDSLVICNPIATLELPAFTFWTDSTTWSYSSSSSTLMISAADTYTIETKNIYSCPNPSITLKIYLKFSKGIKVTSSDSILCVGETASLNVSGSHNFLWSTGDTLQSILVSPAINTNYTVSSVDSLGCSASTAIFLQVDNCTNLKGLKNTKNEISIYPNPNNGEFTLNLEKEISKGELMIETSLGQLVHKQTVLQGKNTIKTKVLPNAVYYYSVYENKQLISKGKLTIE